MDDIQEAFETLQRKGVEFNARQLAITEGPLAGYSFAYFTDPDGVQLEIFETSEILARQSPWFEHAVREASELIDEELPEFERELHEVLEIAPAPFESIFD